MRSRDQLTALARIDGHGTRDRVHWADFDDDELRDIASDLSYWGLWKWSDRAFAALKYRHTPRRGKTSE